MEVQIKNISDKKLKKDYSLVVPYEMIDAKVNDYIKSVKGKFSLKGFRKGQVPDEIIKEKYGQSIMAEESDKIISESIRKIVKDNDLKLALSPKIDVKIFEPNKDVELSATFELYPDVPEIEIKKVKVAQRIANIEESDIDEALNKLVKFYRKWNEQDASYKAKKGDSVNIDYVGKIDKEEFEGGAAKGHQLELGSKSFIDNFEDQLVGKKAGDEVKVKVKFPKEYHSEQFAGKAAEFEVKINKVLTGEMPELDDKFIKDNFGMENKEKLREAVAKQVENNYTDLSRNLFKKEFFDFLNKKYDFDLPVGLVDSQLETLWAEVEQELKANPEKFKNDKEKQKEKDKKRKLAERMIRCGMLLSEVAQKNKIEANNDDLNKEIGKILARFQNQEKAVLEYYQKNPKAIEQLKGSIIEEKAIDFILNQSELERKKISIKEFDKLWQKANKE